MALIQDIIPPHKQNFDTVAKEPSIIDRLAKMPTPALIEELWIREVGIDEVFRQFYAIEEMDAARSRLTVADAELAGFVPDDFDPHKGF